MTNDPQQEYERARAAHIKALAKVKRAKAALIEAKTKPPQRIYTMADIDAFFPLNLPRHNEPPPGGNDHE